MKSFKEIRENAKNWVKEHKKGLITAGISVVTVTVGAVLYGTHQRKKMNELREESEQTSECETESESKWGRNCTMTFTVDETGEVLGTVPCTEVYAMESLEW